MVALCPHALANDKHTLYFIICLCDRLRLNRDCVHHTRFDRFCVGPDTEQIKPFETVIKRYTLPCLCCKHNVIWNIFKRSQTNRRIEAWICKLDIRIVSLAESEHALWQSGHKKSQSHIWSRVQIVHYRSSAVVMRPFFSDGVKQQPNYGKMSLGGADTHTTTIFSNI